jgi:hypothetical protein
MHEVIAKFSKAKEAAAVAKPKAPALSAMPPGGDDGAPPKPAKPRLSKVEHDAVIAREKEKLERKRARLDEDLRNAKAERAQLEQVRAIDRMRREQPAEFIRRLTGRPVRETFENIVREEKDPSAHQARVQSEALREQLADLQRFRENAEREEMGRRAWAALSAEVGSYQGRSEVLKAVPRQELVEITAGILNENPGATPRQALEAVEARLANARPKPAPAPAKKPTAPAKPTMANPKAFAAYVKQQSKKGHK